MGAGDGSVRILGEFFTFPSISKHPEPVEGCGLARPASFDRLRMLVAPKSERTRGGREHPGFLERPEGFSETLRV